MGEDVTLKQEIFCQSWVDTVGNGTQSALIAFDIANKELFDIADKDRTDEQRLLANLAYKTASVMSNDYLRKASVIKRIDDILEERGFVDSIVKQEHFKLIKNADENTKMRAIDSYYKLKGKITDKLDTKVSMTVNIDKDIAETYGINGIAEENS
ncbi:MAG: hypothetical protein HGA35_06690 [Erysipelotrichaceae bacterium]|nr:hypothetical protein [Erysipelotrichaceae bacterium]